MFWLRTDLVLLVVVVVCVFVSGRAQESGGLLGNFVEGFVKDLFKKEMTTVDRANMTDCMTRLLCEQICKRTAKGQITEPLVDSKEIMGKDASLPKNLPYFFAGGDQGFLYGQNKECHKCAERYTHCDDDQYDSALDMTNDFISHYVPSQ